MIKFKLGVATGIDWNNQGDAIMPSYGSDGAAGIDFYLPFDLVLRPYERTIIDLGLSVELQKGKALLLLPRSGTGSKGLRLVNTIGLIDSDYRGSICAVVSYEPDSDSEEYNMRIPTGKAFIQGIIIDAPQYELVQVDELSDTARGTGGFGSTDKH